MNKQRLFGDYTPEELEKFESETNGIVVFNSIGENAISFQVVDQVNVVLHIDRVEHNNNKENVHPDAFLLGPSEVARVYNLL